MRRRDIMSTYCTVSRSDKFEFLYEYYYNYKNILSCERSCVIYMIESFMMKYHWDEYGAVGTREERRLKWSNLNTLVASKTYDVIRMFI